MLHWETFDQLIRDSLNKILGVSLNNSAWLQAQLPITRGGLGMRSASNHASVAFLASWTNSVPLILQMIPSLELSPLSTVGALEHLSKVLEVEDAVSLESVDGISQKELSLRVDDKLYNELIEAAETVRDKARLASVELPHAGDWLYVVPSPALGLQLRPPEFRVSVLYRLGMPIFQAGGACVACDRPSDVFGDHAVGCASQGERIARHNHLRDALYHTAVSAHLAPIREDRALLPRIHNQARPADVMLPHYAGGLHLALDISVVSSLQAQLVDRAATEPGHALQHRFNEKWRKYGEACQTEGIVFQPMPVEVLGGLHEASVSIVKRLGQSLARAGGQDDAEVVKHLFGRLSILLMKGNSQLILSRCINPIDPHINGYL